MAVIMKTHKGKSSSKQDALSPHTFNFSSFSAEKKPH